MTSPLVDGARLALGTLTVLPTRPPVTVDRSTGSWAMTFAPLVGLLLALAATVLQWLLGWSPFGGVPSLYDVLARQDLVLARPAPPLLVAALTVGLLAILTRAIHLDGLADTADGLGSGKPAAQALDIMRRSDIGPFGVVTLVLVLLVQVVALAQQVAVGRGPFAIVLALVVSRLVLPLVCSRGIRAARADGLGRAVAGSVSLVQLAVAAATGCVAVLAYVAVVLGANVSSGTDLARIVLTAGMVAVVALAAGAAMGWWCVRRLGGVTGDVMGACVEVTFTVALVVLTMV